MKLIPNLGFTLAAVALNDHHPLSFVGGNQAIADELLQGRDVLRVKQTVQKFQPDSRCRSVFPVSNREPVSHNVRLTLSKSAVQQKRSVYKVNPLSNVTT